MQNKWKKRTNYFKRGWKYHIPLLTIFLVYIFLQVSYHIGCLMLLSVEIVSICKLSQYCNFGQNDCIFFLL